MKIQIVISYKDGKTFISYIKKESGLRLNNNKLILNNILRMMVLIIRLLIL